MKFPVPAHGRAGAHRRSCQIEGEKKMERLDKISLTRRDMLKLSGAGAGVFALTASGFAVPRGFGSGGGGGGGSLYLEAFPTSPLILNPFTDELVIPEAMRPVDKTNWTNPTNVFDPKKKDAKGNPAQIHPEDRTTQDCLGNVADGKYQQRYGHVLGQHQVWCDDLNMPDPIIYKIDVEVAQHAFTSSKVQPINSAGQKIVAPGNRGGAQNLPKSTIYGFNGTFPGPRINARYGQPSLVHFCNHLDENPHNYDRQDFGAPNYSFLTPLHNGHTAPESDGQPHYGAYRFGELGRFTHEAAFEPGEWVNQMYLGYPAGGDSREKQSFFWF